MLTSALREILKPHEVSFFKQNGYIVKRQILDPDLMKKNIDLTWEKLPDSLERTNPETWKGIVTDSCKTLSLAQRRGHVKLRECIHSNDLLINLLPRNPVIRGVLEQLLGEGKAIPKDDRARGVYPIFPYPKSKYILELKHVRLLKDAFANFHYDRHEYQIATMGYLDDVLPGGGGLYVWPKSHRLMYRAFNSRSNNEPNILLPLVRSIYRLRRPVEIHGRAGDVIFFHQRLLHRASTNYTQRIRYAILCDFYSKDFKQALDYSKREGKRDTVPRGKNMWEGWNI